MTGVIRVGIGVRTVGLGKQRPGAPVRGPIDPKMKPGASAAVGWRSFSPKARPLRQRGRMETASRGLSRPADRGSGPAFSARRSSDITIGLQGRF